jgi:predicted aspartyl protease
MMACAAARWLLLAPFLLLLAGAARGEDCALKRVASLPLDLSDRAPRVEVSIGGSTLRFLVDLGSPYSMIDEGVATRLGLESRAIVGLDIYVLGQVVKRYVEPEHLRIGGAEIGRRLALSLIPAGKLGTDEEGLLGLDFLGRFDLDFDFGQSRLNLFSPQHCKGQVAYWTTDYTTVPFSESGNRHLVVPVTLDGKPIDAILETGSQSSILDAFVARLRFGLDRDQLVADAGAGKERWLPHRFESLKLEGVAVGHPVLYIGTSQNEEEFSRRHRDKGQFDPRTRVELEKPELVIGMDILQGLHLFIAFDERLLYVSAAGAH